MHDHVGTAYEIVHRDTVKDVSAPVGNLAQAEGRGVEWAPGHGHHLAHSGFPLERAQKRASDISGGAGDGHPEPGGHELAHGLGLVAGLSRQDDACLLAGGHDLGLDGADLEPAGVVQELVRRAEGG